jgi:7-cyano-7-deazaguanine reductase
MKKETLDDSPLGHTTDYPDRYDASLLFPIARAEQRTALGIRGAPPFTGVDLWTAYEISWLDPRGKPQLAIGTFQVQADSPAIVESKSLKLYLGAYAQESLADSDTLGRRIAADLTRACGSEVEVALTPSVGFGRVAVSELPGESLDAMEVAQYTYTPDKTLLTTANAVVDETLRSALFRSNCPVTGQPDYADIMVRYHGPRIDRAGLLRYLVSYRKHAAFHESCVEQIFVELLERCQPHALTVYARFLRRGGIDINPFRSNFETAPSRSDRTPRQ